MCPSAPSPHSCPPTSPTHLRSGTTPSAPGISLRFLPTVTWKKGKTKKVQGLGAQPRGSMRWDTDGQGLLPLQPAPEPPPGPWLQKQGGAGAGTGPRGSVSGSGGAPGSITQRGRCGRTQKRKKTLSSNKGKNPKVHPSL